MINYNPRLDIADVKHGLVFLRLFVRVLVSLPTRCIIIRIHAKIAGKIRSLQYASANAFKETKFK